MSWSFPVQTSCTPCPSVFCPPIKMVNCLGLHWIKCNSTGVKTCRTCGVWGPGFTAAIYSAASTEAANGSRPESAWSPGRYCVSCHYRGMRVISDTRTVHVLLCLDLDDRILWYNTIEVCMGRLDEAL